MRSGGSPGTAWEVWGNRARGGSRTRVSLKGGWGDVKDYHRKLWEDRVMGRPRGRGGLCRNLSQSPEDYAEQKEPILKIYIV